MTRALILLAATLMLSACMSQHAVTGRLDTHALRFMATDYALPDDLNR